MRTTFVDVPATRLVELLSKAVTRPSRDSSMPRVTVPLPVVPLLKVAAFNVAPVVRSSTVGRAGGCGLVFERGT